MSNGTLQLFRGLAGAETACWAVPFVSVRWTEFVTEFGTFWYKDGGVASEEDIMFL